MERIDSELVIAKEPVLRDALVHAVNLHVGQPDSSTDEFLAG